MHSDWLSSGSFAFISVCFSGAKSFAWFFAFHLASDGFSGPWSLSSVFSWFVLCSRLRFRLNCLISFWSFLKWTRRGEYEWVWLLSLFKKIWKKDANRGLFPFLWVLFPFFPVPWLFRVSLWGCAGSLRFPWECPRGLGSLCRRETSGRAELSSVFSISFGFLCFLGIFLFSIFVFYVFLTFFLLNFWIFLFLFKFSNCNKTDIDFLSERREFFAEKLNATLAHGNRWKRCMTMRSKRGVMQTPALHNVCFFGSAFTRFTPIELGHLTIFNMF